MEDIVPSNHHQSKQVDGNHLKKEYFVQGGSGNNYCLGELGGVETWSRKADGAPDRRIWKRNLSTEHKDIVFCSAKLNA